MSTTAECACDFATRYAAAGLSVLSIRPDGSKAPAVAKWEPFQQHIATPDEIKRMFGGRKVGVGIIGGAVSGNLEIIDFDVASIFAPFVDEVDMQAPGLMHKLTVIATPREQGGGRQLVYRCAVVEGNQPLAQFRTTDPKTGKPQIKASIETRGEGGYVVTVGSPIECHLNRLHYRHIKGPPLTQVSTITVEEREVLFRVARSFTEIADEPSALLHRNGHAGLSPGDDFNSRATWEQILEPEGWVHTHSRGPITYWQRPGKDDPGCSATTGLKSGTGVELFCVFSTSAHPFDIPPNKKCGMYSKFAAYATLHHKGDFSAAAKALAAEGYGEQQHNGDGNGHVNGARFNRIAAEVDAGMYGAPAFDPWEPAGVSTRASTGDDKTKTEDSDKIVYQRLTCAELDAAEYTTEYLVERTLVAGQPLIFAGGKKTLKTSLLVDLGISVATGGKFLGHLRCSRSARVALMSGESGLPTLQETARRIAKAANWNLADIQNLIFSPDLPVFGNLYHVNAFKKFLTDDEIEVVILDPAYLCIPTDGNEGSLFAVGKLLRAMSEVCQACGATMVLAHHTKKGVVDPFQPVELEDISWAGFQEFARQWLLVSRREKYEPGSGEHKLWLNVGGSAGHSALLGVDIAEGVYDGQSPRYWDVEVRKAEDVREEAGDAQENARQAKRDEQQERAKKNILAAVGKFPEGETKKTIRERVGMSGAKFNVPFEELLDANEIVHLTITKENKRTYDAYKLAT